MDLGVTLVFLIIFGIFGFIISRIWGINPYRIFSDLCGAIMIVSFIAIMFPAVLNPEQAIENIPDLIQFFASALPGIIIGDAAGSIVAGITD